MTIASVQLWGRQIGAVLLDDGVRAAVFQYEPAFLSSGIQLSPLMMPLSDRPYTFPVLPPETFRGLPGLLADSLPDKYGTALVNAWLAAQGRDEGSFDVVERLCYVGTRGMGALEFQPAHEPARPAPDIRLDALVRLASEMLTAREDFVAELAHGDDAEAMRAILSVGTSAGGARAKAVIAYNTKTGQVRSGQVDAGPGFEHWLLKFDGVSNNRDKGLADPQGWGAVEYAYSLMARAAGIDMA
jgi:serine/threonine-protein kinase HipA